MGSCLLTILALVYSRRIICHTLDLVHTNTYQHTDIFMTQVDKMFFFFEEIADE